MKIIIVCTTPSLASNTPHEVCDVDNVNVDVFVPLCQGDTTYLPPWPLWIQKLRHSRSLTRLGLTHNEQRASPTLQDPFNRTAVPSTPDRPTDETPRDRFHSPVAFLVCFSDVLTAGYGLDREKPATVATIGNSQTPWCIQLGSWVRSADVGRNARRLARTCHDYIECPSLSAPT